MYRNVSYFIVVNLDCKNILREKSRDLYYLAKHIAENKLNTIFLKSARV